MICKKEQKMPHLRKNLARIGTARNVHEWSESGTVQSRFVVVARSFKIKKTMILTDFQNHRFFSFYIFLGFFVSVKLFKHVLVFFCN